MHHLAMKRSIKDQCLWMVYGEFNRGRSSLQDEFREGRPKSNVVPETIDAVRQLILQDRHVTYRRIEPTFGIRGTSIHSIFHENLTRVNPEIFTGNSTNKHCNALKNDQDFHDYEGCLL